MFSNNLYTKKAKNQNPTIVLQHGSVYKMVIASNLGDYFTFLVRLLKSGVYVLNGGTIHRVTSTMIDNGVGMASNGFSYKEEVKKTSSVF